MSVEMPLETTVAEPAGLSMGYPTVLRLACVVAAEPTRVESLPPQLAAARDAAERAAPGAAAWAGVPIDDFVASEDVFGRPVGAPIDGVIEVTLPSDDDPHKLVSAAAAVGEALDGWVRPEACEVVLGTGYLAKSGSAPYALAYTNNRDRRTDASTFVHWWQFHHSRLNLLFEEPTGRPAGERMISYELVSADDSITAAAAAASGFSLTSESWCSIQIDDPAEFFAAAAGSGHAEAALRDEDGYISHEWLLGTPAQAAAAVESRRDLMRVTVVELLPPVATATGH